MSATTTCGASYREIRSRQNRILSVMEAAIVSSDKRGLSEVRTISPHRI